jgi:hypothetical protein
MTLSAQHKSTLKADIAANTATINGVQIKNMPNNSDANFAIAQWYSSQAAPDYFVWRTSVARAEIYNITSESGTSWDWTFYKNQSVTEQNAWVQMFMGDQADFSRVNLRAGIGKIFTAGSSVNRDHALAIGRRRANRVEKLFGTAVANPPANTGNDGGVRGTATNPDVMGYEGAITGDDVESARNS